MNMDSSSNKKTVEELLIELNERYENDGLKLRDHLEGLIYHNGVNYWDYISVDTLLTLQKPITHFNDEYVFIIYHQISELYFKLCIHELTILTNRDDKYFKSIEEWETYLSKPINWIKHLKRIKLYFNSLIRSIVLMSSSFLDNTEFGKFRLSLIPGSGFQTAQFREMELMITDLQNLQYKGKKLQKGDWFDYYNNIYWKTGGLRTIKDETGAYVPFIKEINGEKKQIKTKTLINFETRYDEEFKKIAKSYATKNIYNLYKNTFEIKGIKDDDLIKLLSEIDQIINKQWKGAHFGAIRSQLEHSVNSSGNDEQGTGGTNWKEFLPPESQQIKYFPSISNWDFSKPRTIEEDK